MPADKPQPQPIPNAKGGGGVEALPPAGDARREVLKARTDDLAEQAETLGADGGAIREDAFEIDNEIGAAFNEMDPPHKRADFRYKWVYVGAQGRGRGQSFVQAKTQGWMPVRHSDPDGKGMTHCDSSAEGFVVVGDAMLMRIPLERYIAIRRRERDLVMRKELTIDAELRQKAEAAGVRAYDHDELIQVNQRWNSAMEARASAAMALKAEAQRLDKMIRNPQAFRPR